MEGHESASTDSGLGDNPGGLDELIVRFRHEAGENGAGMHRQFLELSERFITEAFDRGRASREDR